MVPWDDWSRCIGEVKDFHCWKLCCGAHALVTLQLWVISMEVVETMYGEGLWMVLGLDGLGLSCHAHWQFVSNGSLGQMLDGCARLYRVAKVAFVK